MARSNKIVLISLLGFALCHIFLPAGAYALDQIITIPSESPGGIELDIPKGEYMVRIEGGAASLFYPINPNYRWLIGISVGAGVEGGQDEANLGTLYFEPDPPVNNQAEAEAQAVKAVKDDLPGTSLELDLREDKKVRFWVSDFDYTDNSGMVKLRISSLIPQ